MNKELLNFNSGKQWRVEGSKVTFKDGVATMKSAASLLTKPGVLSKDEVGKYDRLVVDYYIAGRPVTDMSLATTGFPQTSEHSAPRWAELDPTSPTDQWIIEDYDLNLPEWNGGKSMIKHLSGTGLTLRNLLGGGTKYVKMRDIRFIADPFKVKYDWIKPFEPLLITRHDDGTLSYKKTFTLISKSDKPVSIDVKVENQDSGFKPSVSPSHVELQPGENKTVTFTAQSSPSMPTLKHERMSVVFTPNGKSELVQHREFMVAAPTADQKTKPIFGTDGKPHNLSQAMALPLRLPPGPVAWLTQSQINNYRKWKVVGNAKFKDNSGKIHGVTDKSSGAMHRRIIKTIGRLADAYLATHNKKYAQRVRDWFLLYAEKGSDYKMAKPLSEASSYLCPGNATYVQGAVVMNPLMKALNKVWYSGVFSDEQKKTIHDQFILPRVLESSKITAGVSNQQDELNKFIFVAGVTTNDPDLMALGVYGTHGLAAKLNTFTPDGSTEESISPNYHGVIVKKVRKTVNAIQAAGLDLGLNLDRLHKAEHLQEKMVMPNGQVPNRGDTPTPSRAMSPAKAKKLPSKTFDYFGMSILRGGKNKGKDTMYVALDHRPPASSHSHHDKLSIVLYGEGHIFGVDDGSLYNIGAGKSKNVSDWKRRKSWGHVSLVHNTITVDKQDQISGGGHRLYFQGDDAPIKAVGAYTDNSFKSDVRFERHIAMQGGIIVIVDRLFSDKPHTYDLTHHSFGNISTDVRMHSVGQLGDQGEYKLPENVKAGNVQAHQWAAVSWKQGSDQMQYQVLNTADSSMPLLTATGWANVKYHLVRQPAPFLLARQKSKNAVFVSVINFGGQPVKVTSQNLTADKFSIQAGGKSFVFDFKNNTVKPGPVAAAAPRSR